MKESAFTGKKRGISEAKKAGKAPIRAVPRNLFEQPFLGRYITNTQDGLKKLRRVAHSCSIDSGPDINEERATGTGGKWQRRDWSPGTELGCD